MRPRQVEVKSKGQPIKSEKQLLRSKKNDNTSEAAGPLEAEDRRRDRKSQLQQETGQGVRGGVLVFYAA